MIIRYIIFTFRVLLKIPNIFCRCCEGLFSKVFKILSPGSSSNVPREWFPPAWCPVHPRQPGATALGPSIHRLKQNKLKAQTFHLGQVRKIGMPWISEWPYIRPDKSTFFISGTGSGIRARNWNRLRHAEYLVTVIEEAKYAASSLQTEVAKVFPLESANVQLCMSSWIV